MTQTPDSVTSSTFGLDPISTFWFESRKSSTVESIGSFLGPDHHTSTPKDSLRRQRRKEQNRAAQRAYRERKVNRTVELEGQINYLKIHNDDLRVKNKQLEVDISRTRVENGALRTTLMNKWRPPSEPAPGLCSQSNPDSSPLPQSNLGLSTQGKPVLLKDLLMVYGPGGDDDMI